MSLPAFDFALHLSDPTAFEGLLDEVSAAVLRSVGLDAAQVADMARALPSAAGSGPCDVTFHAAQHLLQVTVTAAGKPATRLSYPLP